FPALRMIRRAARTMGLWQSSLGPFAANDLRSSIEGSLRRLRTDRLDILLLHEPNLGRLVRRHELLDELSDLRRRGLIRAFGVAGAWGAVAPIVQAIPELSQIVQTSDGEWPGDR